MTQRNVFVEAAESVANDWEREAETRKRRTPGDAAAEAIASCAAELRAKMALVERDTAFLSVADFATHRGMHESTVRRLCRQGELPGAAQDLNGDWQIPRDVQRVQRRGSLQRAS